MNPALTAGGISIIKELITAGASYMACREHERTERERISAQLEACLTAINTNYSLFSQALAQNHEYAMKAYDTAEKLLANPVVAMNATLLEKILTFLQNSHSVSNDRLSSMVNGIAANPLPKIR